MTDRTRKLHKLQGLGPTACLVKHVFLDVVGFTSNRSVEAQAAIVATISKISRAAIAAKARHRRGTLYLPTGDGLCISIADPRCAYDTHLQVALDILARISHHNAATPNEMRRFDVRIGIAENVDTLLTDVNGNPNVAGAGINTAQRVMCLGDGGNILVSDTVFDSLRHRERYMRCFRSFSAPIKHGLQLTVHQFIESDHAGLRSDPPESVRPRKKPMTRLLAYVLAYALKNAAFFRAQEPRGQMRAAGNVLLYMLARDAVELSESSPVRPPTLYGPNDRGGASFEEQFAYYMRVDYGICAELDHFALEAFTGHADCFESLAIHGFLWYASDVGLRRLQNSYPDIWAELKLPGMSSVAEQDDAANESQPIGSETNRTSSAAGSRR
jgi:class 3 adenylate cyclase